jgi:hypothetical protein
VGQSIPALPSRLDVDLFCNSYGIVDLDAEISDSALDLGMAEQKLDSSQIAGAPVNERRLCPAQRMGPVNMQVQPDAREPVRKQPRVLTGRHGVSRPPTGEQKVARLLTFLSDVVVEGLASLLRQLEPDGTPCLSLAHGGSIDGIAVGSNVIDFDHHRPWLTALLARRPTKVAAIALANKVARMAWAMMAKGERYKKPVALAA